MGGYAPDPLCEECHKEAAVMNIWRPQGSIELCGVCHLKLYPEQRGGYGSPRSREHTRPMKRYGPPMIDRRLKRKQTRSAVEAAVMGEQDLCVECDQHPAMDDDFCSIECKTQHEVAAAEHMRDTLEDR